MVSFVLLFFSCLIPLTAEMEMSLNYSLAIISFSHKELFKLPEGLTISGENLHGFYRRNSRKSEKPTSRFLVFSSVWFGIVDFCPNLQPCK